ncbi:MAG: AAA family ATPase, partial [bacterium]
MKKEAFKFVIREFQDRELPDVRPRKLEIPDIEKVISITGIRRSGKTCYFFQLIKDLLEKVSKDRVIYINLADDRLFPLKLDDLQDILEAYFELYPQNRDQTLYLFLDEIQEVAHWELFVRRIYDQHNVRIFVTGSSSKMMHTEIHTALRGRTLNYEMFPLSFSEVLDFKNLQIPQHVHYSEH